MRLASMNALSSVVNAVRHSFSASRSASRPLSKRSCSSRSRRGSSLHFFMQAEDVAFGIANQAAFSFASTAMWSTVLNPGRS